VVTDSSTEKRRRQASPSLFLFSLIAWCAQYYSVLQGARSYCRSSGTQGERRVQPGLYHQWATPALTPAHSRIFQLSTNLSLWRLLDLCVSCCLGLHPRSLPICAFFPSVVDKKNSLLLTAEAWGNGFAAGCFFKDTLIDARSDSFSSSLLIESLKRLCS
jgi:hypothetical protein